MSKIAFREINFHGKSRERIQQAVEILEEYGGQKLTSRQLYYQFVSRGYIPNTEASYKNMTNLITDARYAGLIDWNAIEDRGREPDIRSEWKDVGSLMDTALKAYRLPRWQGQEYYCELWVEKQALAGVLSPIAFQYHITLMVNKGYSSASAMFESSLRFQRASDNHDNLVLLYLGDHDPSGEDMVRDIRERLHEFGPDVDVRKVALTMDQVNEYNPPPNPAKITDSRATGYIAKYGEHSWEVDALPPKVLTQIIEDSIKSVLDEDLMDDVISKEESDKVLIRKAVESLKGER